MVVAERLADAAIEYRLGLEPTDDDRLAYEACQFLLRSGSMLYRERGTRATTLRKFSARSVKRN
eukprot:scaffold5770_cov61-Phaeocystis_antarctica.AAC.2